MSYNAHELRNRLLNALDNNYNVVDMHAVNEIISILEKFNITKELLETTRLGKHVNELRRKTTDLTLARRAKVLVKRWRDLVIPNVASPAHTGSNRSSAERQVRRLGGTPLTSPALSRVVSPAVASPRPPSRPAWGGYESDSQDVILVDDDPPAPAPPPPAAPPLLATPPLKPITPPVKRPLSPEPVLDDKKAKRDKKLRKKRFHGRAGSGAESTAGAAAPSGAGAGAGAAPGAPWASRNGAHAADRRRNGCRRDNHDPYTALVNRMPPAGAKKVKTTKELLEQIQSRGTVAPASPRTPGSPHSPDVMLIEPESFAAKVESPLRNGGSSRPPSPPAESPLPPLEDAREYAECTCGEEPSEDCPAALRLDLRPLHVRALHNAFLPGINGTRAPTEPHKFAVRAPHDLERPDLFVSVVPLYKYSDYADDYCAKNLSQVPLCTHLPWTEFAPSPPSPPPPLSPPPLRPYPVEEEVEDGKTEEVQEEETDISQKETKEEVKPECPKIEAEMVSVPNLEPSERLKAPLLTVEDETQFGKEKMVTMEVEEEFKEEPSEHRTVVRTKEEPLDGQALYDLTRRTIDTIPYDYDQISAAPVVTLPRQETEAQEVLEEALVTAQADGERDEFGRPVRPSNFTEWHECVKLGSLIALPYVVLD